MAMMVDRNLVKYEDKIADHWPEFAKNGKADTTIADLMRHESGLPYFKESFKNIDQLFTNNIKENSVGKVIEEQTPFFPKDTRRQYHAYSRGLIVSEIVRRVDEEKRTLGEIIAEDIGIDGIRSGLKEEERPTSDLIETPLGFYIKQSLLPKWAGRKIPFGCLTLLKMLKGFDQMVKDFGPPLVEGWGNSLDVFNSQEVRTAEICSVNCNCSARGLAKLAAIMANKGQPLDNDRKPLMSVATWEDMHADPNLARTVGLMNFRSNFTKGGVNFFNQEEGADSQELAFVKNREGFFGWLGMGGSIFQWHPELKIGFAFVPTKLLVLDLTSSRGGALQGIVKKCVNRLNTSHK